MFAKSKPPYTRYTKWYKHTVNLQFAASKTD